MDEADEVDSGRRSRTTQDQESESEEFSIPTARDQQVTDERLTARELQVTLSDSGSGVSCDASFYSDYC